MSTVRAQRGWGGTDMSHERSGDRPAAGGMEGMDVYHIWCDLKDGRDDKAFAAAVAAYLDHHKAGGRIESWRLMRRKLGLGPDGMGEFHIMIETKDLASA